MSFEIINFIGLDIPVAKTIQHNHLQCNSPVQDANAARARRPGLAITDRAQMRAAAQLE